MKPILERYAWAAGAGLCGGLVALAVLQQPLVVLLFALLAGMVGGFWSSDPAQPEGKRTSPWTSRTVRQVMIGHVVAVPETLPLWRLLDWLAGCKPGFQHHGYPVVDAEGRLVGMVTRSDVPPSFARDVLGWLIVADVMNSRPPIVAYPDEPLPAAAHRMASARIGRLPVVAPEAPDRLIGLLTRGDLLHALMPATVHEAA